VSKLAYKEVRDLTNETGTVAIEEKYVYDVGHIRYEIGEEVAVIHPMLYTVTPSGFKEFKNLILDKTIEVCDKYYVDDIFMCTDNKKFINMVYNKAVYVQPLLGMELYYVNIEELKLCHK
jgi:hypothetical protein